MDDQGPEQQAAQDEPPFPICEWPYLVLADRLEDRIRSGEFGQDGQLPTTDQLAERYSQKIGVIRHARKELMHRGLATFKPWQGYFARMVELPRSQATSCPLCQPRKQGERPEAARDEFGNQSAADSRVHTTARGSAQFTPWAIRGLSQKSTRSRLGRYGSFMRDSSGATADNAPFTRAS